MVKLKSLKVRCEGVVQGINRVYVLILVIIILQPAGWC